MHGVKGVTETVLCLAKHQVIYTVFVYVVKMEAIADNNMVRWPLIHYVIVNVFTLLIFIMSLKYQHIHPQEIDNVLHYVMSF